MHTILQPTLYARSCSVIIGIILALTVSAKGVTLTVTSTADSGGLCPGENCTLRQAIAAAKSGDTINFSLPALSTIELTSGELLVGKDLTISGPGAPQLSVARKGDSGIPPFRIFNIQTNVTISGLTITGGFLTSEKPVVQQGGGIFYNGVGASLTIARCAIYGNFATDQGGGIYCGQGNVTITDSYFAENSANDRNGSAAGGGIYSSNISNVTITNTTISQNNAKGKGGGIYNNFGHVTVTNSTIAENSTIIGDGGGVYNDTSSASGGVFTVKNTIIADNTVPNSASGPDFRGILASQGYDLIGNTNGTSFTGTTTGNQLDVNPALRPVQDNGGPTSTYALLSGSPAIDAGNSGGSITDQRGMARPVDSPTIPNASGGDGSDIGAYEVQPDSLPGCNTLNTPVSNNHDSGTGSLRAIIANVCNGSTITFADNVRGAINLTSGELAISKSLTINGPGANLLSVQRSAAAGTPSFRVFNIASGVNAGISGLTIANGNLPGALDFGGGILNDGLLTLSSVDVTGNSAGIGGGISNGNGTLNLTNSTLSNNSANSGGGVAGGTLNSINSTISGNMARTGNGGGLTVGTVSLINTTIAHNSAAAGSGGGVFNNGNNGATVYARNSIIALNTAASAPDVSGALTSRITSISSATARARPSRRRNFPIKLAPPFHRSTRSSARSRTTAATRRHMLCAPAVRRSIKATPATRQLINAVSLVPSTVPTLATRRMAMAPISERWK